MSTILSSNLDSGDADIPGVRLIEARHFADDRGWFTEMWNAERYRAAGLDVEFTQDNVSYSRRGVLRGMHFQSPHPQGKLVSVIAGAIFDVVVDVRAGSPAFGRWLGRELTGENRRQLWIPPGCAHGFLVLSDEAYVHYNCTEVYDPAADRTLAWNDRTVAIAWPHPPAMLSDKDRAAPTLADLKNAGVLPAWNG